MVKVLDPRFYRSKEGGIVTRSNIERLLDEHRLQTIMASGRWWDIRRNGKTQTWKTQPDRFRIPFKYGLKFCGALTQADMVEFVAGDGPSRKREYRDNAPLKRGDPGHEDNDMGM